MRFVIAQMKQEPHSFMPEMVPLKAFNSVGEATSTEDNAFEYQHIDRPVFTLDAETQFQLDKQGRW